TSRPLREGVLALIDLARQRGGPDNITALAIRVDAVGDPPGEGGTTRAAPPPEVDTLAPTQEFPLVRDQGAERGTPAPEGPQPAQGSVPAAPPSAARDASGTPPIAAAGAGGATSNRGCRGAWEREGEGRRAKGEGRGANQSPIAPRPTAHARPRRRPGAGAGARPGRLLARRLQHADADADRRRHRRRP